MALGSMGFLRTFTGKDVRTPVSTRAGKRPAASVGAARGSPPENDRQRTAGLLACGSLPVRLAFPVRRSPVALVRGWLAAYSCGVSSGVAASAAHRIPCCPRPLVGDRDRYI